VLGSGILESLHGISLVNVEIGVVFTTADWNSFLDKFGRGVVKACFTIRFPNSDAPTTGSLVKHVSIESVAALKQEYQAHNRDFNGYLLHGDALDICARVALSSKTVAGASSREMLTDLLSQGKLASSIADKFYDTSTRRFPLSDTALSTKLQSYLEPRVRTFNDSGEWKEFKRDNNVSDLTLVSEQEIGGGAKFKFGWLELGELNAETKKKRTELAKRELERRGDITLTTSLDQQFLIAEEIRVSQLKSNWDSLGAVERIDLLVGGNLNNGILRTAPFSMAFTRSEFERAISESAAELGGIERELGELRNRAQTSESRATELEAEVSRLKDELTQKIANAERAEIEASDKIAELEAVVSSRNTTIATLRQRVADQTQRVSAVTNGFREALVHGRLFKNSKGTKYWLNWDNKICEITLAAVRQRGLDPDKAIVNEWIEYLPKGGMIDVTPPRIREHDGPRGMHR